MVLNAMQKQKHGSERQNEDKQWLWMPCRNNGFERQTKTDNYVREAEKDDSERCKWEDMLALNAKLKNDQRL